jgi:hypothetical protein
MRHPRGVASPPCVPPLKGLNSKYPPTQRSTTPIHAKTAWLGDPGEALGYDLPSRVAGLGSFPVQLAADLKT